MAKLDTLRLRLLAQIAKNGLLTPDDRALVDRYHEALRREKGSESYPEMNSPGEMMGAAMAS